MRAGLTQKQENFCQAYVACGNASEAYRKVYNCEKSKPESVNRNAKALLDNIKISSRLEELRGKAEEETVFSLAEHLNSLKELRDEARAAGQFGAAVNAEVSRGKAAGHYTEKKKISGELIIGWEDESDDDQAAI